MQSAWEVTKQVSETARTDQDGENVVLSALKTSLGEAESLVGSSDDSPVVRRITKRRSQKFIVQPDASSEGWQSREIISYHPIKAASK